MKSNITYFLFFIIFFSGIFKISAHPMPNSVVLMDVYQDRMSCTIKIPIKELKLAVPFDVENTANLNMKNIQLVNYLNQHFNILDENSVVWKKSLQKISAEKAEQNGTGKYEELVADFTIFPNGKNPRKFVVDYSAVIHQVNSHRAMVAVRQDWETGRIGEENSELGTIGYDLDTGKPNLLYIDLEHGSNWEGFKSMIKLGMKHISEGTDHLMFLLVLLLTAPLIAVGKKWKSSPNIKQSFFKILKISIAFTIGHSLTLVLGTLGIIRFPAKPVEIFIAVSILITAVHAIVPVFPNKENILAGVFGLIHGLAFSTVLSELHLTKERLVLSLLGFNIGIEIMQLIIILMVIPWFVLISRYQIYIKYKNFLACLAVLASLSWIIERATGIQNFISKYLEVFAKNSILFVVFLFLSFMMFFTFKFKKADE